MTIYRVWFAVTIPLVALAALAIVAGPFPMLAGLVYWWLEPVADGPMLHVISRRLFGEAPSARAALRAAPALAWRNRLFLLTPYRFHVARSIAMPLTQLEGLRGKERRARARVIGSRIMRHGTGLTVAYQHLALSLYGGVILLGFAFVPPEYRDTLGSSWLSLFNFANESRGALLASFFAGYLAQSALQPWFVGAGFGLYINCRTELEAWDLEIAFRRMALRRATATAAAAMIVAAVLASLVGAPGAALAQGSAAGQGDESEAPGIAGYWSDAVVRPAVDEVMSSDELKGTREITTWRRIDRGEPTSPEAGVLGRFLASLGRALALGAEAALWIAVAGLLLTAAVAVWRLRSRASTRRAEAAPSPDHRIVLADGEIKGDTLPADVPGEALRLWRAGQRRRAMSLLYRASVFAVVDRHGVRLPENATEGMCIAAVEQQADAARAEFFRKLVAAWMWCAYAGRDPDDDFVAFVCAQWPKHLGAAA
ncbi:MAG TPA: hypothetical protein VF322_13395 [Gammaproteobacteria bacterium]